MVGKRLAEKLAENQRLHSKLPLSVEYDGEDYNIRDADGALFADVFEYEDQTIEQRGDNAQFIVKACNSFYAMKEALESVTAALDEEINRFQTSSFLHLPSQDAHNALDSAQNLLNSLNADPCKVNDNE